MNTETLYRQYRSYFQTRRSGWRLGSDDGSRLLAQPFDGGGMHRLEAESAALELAAQLLRFTFARHDRPYLRRRIDEAADILRCEFSQTHTIATLTRRVGLNECYLKRCFFQGADRRNRRRLFLRRVRMEHACEMPECGHSIQAAMAQSGYRHAGHFNEAFQRHFGCLPSGLKKNR